MLSADSSCTDRFEGFAINFSFFLFYFFGFSGEENGRHFEWRRSQFVGRALQHEFDAYGDFLKVQKRDSGVSRWP